MKPGGLVLLRNSARDGRKRDKLAEQWLGPYKAKEHQGKGVYHLQNPNTHQILKKTYNGCRYCSCSCILYLFVYLLVHYHIYILTCTVCMMCFPLLFQIEAIFHKAVITTTSAFVVWWQWCFPGLLNSKLKPYCAGEWARWPCKYTYLQFRAWMMNLSLLFHHHSKEAIWCVLQLQPSITGKSKESTTLSSVRLSQSLLFNHHSKKDMWHVLQLRPSVAGRSK